MGPHLSPPTFIVYTRIRAPTPKKEKAVR